MQIQNRVTKEMYFITSTVIDWVDVFTRPAYKHVIIESLSYCQKEKGLIIYAWVLMTNHLHVIVGAKEGYNISDIIRDFKKFTSKKIIALINDNIQESRRDWMLNRFEYAARNDRKVNPARRDKLLTYNILFSSQKHYLCDKIFKKIL